MKSRFHLLLIHWKSWKDSCLRGVVVDSRPNQLGLVCEGHGHGHACFGGLAAIRLSEFRVRKPWKKHHEPRYILQESLQTEVKIVQLICLSWLDLPWSPPPFENCPCLEIGTEFFSHARRSGGVSAEEGRLVGLHPLRHVGCRTPGVWVLWK